MGLFAWLASIFQKKSATPVKIHVYINNTASPIVFIPYSKSDPSNVRLQPNTAKIVSFPGFVYKDFECEPNNVKRMLNDAAAIHICNHPDEQYYYDVDSKTLFLRRQGGGDLREAPVTPGISIEQQVLTLTRTG